MHQAKEKTEGMGTTQSTQTDQTPSGPNEGHEQHILCQPLPRTPTEQTPNEPVQDSSQDLFNPPLDLMSDQNQKKCCSCGTFESIEAAAEYTNLGDGRYLCPDCLPISLMERRQLEPIISQVHSYFKDYLKLPIKKKIGKDYLKLPIGRKIPIFFVDENQMRVYINDAETVYGMFIARKFTLKIVKRCIRRGHDIEAVTKMKKVEGRKGRNVGAILLLFGLPKEVLGSTLAHEMVHALIWLQDWGFKLEREVEESICEAVAYKWLKYTASDHDPAYTEKDAEFAKRLRMLHKDEIKNGLTGTNATEFQKAKRAIKKYGLEHTLKLIGRERNIPE